MYGVMGNMKKTDSRTVHYNWKVRIGSPRELVWELRQFLDGKGYRFDDSYKPLELKRAPIEGTATFESTIEGHRDFPGRSLWRLILGIIFCMTILLIPLGIWLIRKSKHMLSDIISVQVEGEVYRASARTQDPYRAQSEVLDMTGNARILLDAGLKFVRAGKPREVKSEEEWRRMHTEFSQLRDELDKLIPRIALPKAVDNSDKGV